MKHKSNTNSLRRHLPQASKTEVQAIANAIDTALQFSNPSNPKKSTPSQEYVDWFTNHWAFRG